MWTACQDGEMASCDDLYRFSPADSEYEAFGGTCGERDGILGYACEELESGH